MNLLLIIILEAELVDTIYPEVLPKPDRLHHIVEDFLTEFDARTSHLLPLRRYLSLLYHYCAVIL